MKDKILQGLKFVLFIGFGVLLVYMVVSKMPPEDRDKAVDAMLNANYFWLGLSILLGSIAQVSRTIRWQILIKPLGFRPGFWNTLFAVMASYLANLAFPRLGEITRCAVVNRYEKVPVQHLIGTVITERVLDVIALASVLLIGLLVEFDKITEYLGGSLPSGEPVAAQPEPFISRNALFLIVGITIATSIAVFFLFRKTILNLRFYHKVRNAAKGLIDGVKSVRYVDKPWTLVFHSVFIWLLYYLMMYVCIYSLPETSHLGFGAIIAAFVVGAVAMVISPGGIGFYPMFVMGALLLYGIEQPVGTAFGFLVWGSQTVSIILAGVLSLILLPIINRTSGKDETEPEVTPV